MTKITNKAWWGAAAIRAIKTMAQTALASIAVGMTIQETNWGVVASTAIVAGVCSILTSLAGLPEVDTEEAEGE